jgi:hypothetical protein
MGKGFVSSLASSATGFPRAEILDGEPVGLTRPNPVGPTHLIWLKSSFFRFRKSHCFLVLSVLTHCVRHVLMIKSEVLHGRSSI